MYKGRGNRKNHIFFWLQYVPFLVETCQKKFRDFWLTVHGVTALFCHAFYILFESTSCIRLNVGAAKRDVIEGKGRDSTVLARSFVVGNSKSESGAASEASRLDIILQNRVGKTLIQPP